MDVRRPRARLRTAGSYRPGDLREARYGSGELGEAATLGDGLTYTGVLRCGGFEDQLYHVNATPAGTVPGRPAVVTPGLGGNDVLAWEPAPGVVAYVGYSGASPTAPTPRRIAERTRLLSVQQ